MHPWRHVPGRPSGRSLRFENRQEATRRAWNGALYREQATLGVRGENFEILHGDALRAHAASHARSLQYSAWRGARADGACRPPTIRLPVRLGSAVEAVSFHHAGEPASLRIADHIDAVARVEYRDIEFLPDGQLVA